jgi:hypothetical protein
MTTKPTCCCKRKLITEGKENEAITCPWSLGSGGHKPTGRTTYGFSNDDHKTAQWATTETFSTTTHTHTHTLTRNRHADTDKTDTHTQRHVCCDENVCCVRARVLEGACEWLMSRDIDDYR